MSAETDEIADLSGEILYWKGKVENLRALVRDLDLLAGQVISDITAIEAEILTRDGERPRVFASWSTPAHTREWAKELQGKARAVLKCLPMAIWAEDGGKEE